MPKRIRTFIAVEIHAAIRRRIEGLQESLAPAAAGVKWVEPENIHLTLKFLGEVDEREVYNVCKSVEAAVADTAPFEMTVAGVGAFPNASRPRVIWAGVGQGSQDLTAIHDAIDESLEGKGYPREDRSYTPHFTIGRIRRTVPNPRLQNALDQQANWEAGSCPVREVLIMASQLGPKGPQYSVMGRGPLGGGPESSI